MNRVVLGICCALTASLYFWPSAVYASQGQRDLASETRFIFSAKCAGCHGPNLSKPKGRFGYVLDLARVAANREMVVPSFPDESELWELVGRGEMPPEDAPTGPLSAEEKGVIRAWIAAGAPANPQETTSAVRTVGKGILRLVGAISPVGRPLPNRAAHLCGAHGVVARATGQSNPAALGSLLRIVGSGQCRDHRGARLDLRRQRQRRGSAAITWPPPLARHDRGHLGHRHRLLLSVGRPTR